MDFDQLRTFVEVARLGSFSRAAEKVLRSQPAVSTQIRQLEQEYGQKLFDRSAKQVRLTPAGEVVLEYAKQLLALQAKSLHAGADLRGDPADEGFVAAVSAAVSPASPPASKAEARTGRPEAGGTAGRDAGGTFAVPHPSACRHLRKAG